MGFVMDLQLSALGKVPFLRFDAIRPFQFFTCTALLALILGILPRDMTSNISALLLAMVPAKYSLSH